jgi:transposase
MTSTGHASAANARRNLGPLHAPSRPSKAASTSSGSGASICERYRAWLKRRGLSMRQTHHAGEKAFLDYSGKKPSYWDRESGTRVEAELFVAVLGVSNLTFAEASASQQVEQWIGSNMRALNYLEGVPNALVPDQLKSAVAKADAFDPWDPEDVRGICYALPDRDFSSAPS